MGRYLEHSRICHFANGGEHRSGAGTAWFIGSADLMQRNLDHRVEAVVDVVDPSLTAELDELVTLLLHPNGTIDVHRELQAMAKARSSG